MMSEHINTDDKAVLDKYEEQMENNLEKVDGSKSTVTKVAMSQASFGWFNLIYIIVIVLLINYLMGMFINIFHK